jgi:transcriptional regulator with XRE-family HTH domain
VAGLHRTYVGSIERSERNVSIDNIEKLANALRVSISELLNENPA